MLLVEIEEIINRLQKRVYIVHQRCKRGWYSGCASAFQADEEGSNPSPRSITKSLEKRTKDH